MSADWLGPIVADPNATPDLGAAACTYAAANLAIFPLKPRDKVPAFPSAHPEGDLLRGKCHGECGRLGHGFYDATTDPDHIRQWWTEDPSRNIGCWVPEGAAIVDVDPRGGGVASMDQVMAQYGRMPATWVAKTGGGGWHYWLEVTAAITFGTKLAAGVEVKHHGNGYVVLPPSIHPSGVAYQWINPQEAPW